MPGKKEIDPHIIDEMVKLRLDGKKYSQITREIQERGISITQPTVKRIIDENIEKIKNNEPEKQNSKANVDTKRLQEQKDLFAIIDKGTNATSSTTNSGIKNEDTDKVIEKAENGYEDNAQEDNQNKDIESEQMASPVNHEETKQIEDTSINHDDDITMLLYSIMQQVGSVNRKVANIETKLTKQNPYTTITKQADDFFEIYAGKRKSVTLNLSEKLLDEIIEFARTKYGIKRNVSDAINLAMLIALFGYKNGRIKK